MKPGRFSIQILQGIYQFQVLGPGTLQFLQRTQGKPGQIPQRCWVLGSLPRLWPQAPTAFFVPEDSRWGKIPPNSRIPALAEFLTALEENQTWDLHQALKTQPFIKDIQNYQALLPPGMTQETLNTLPVVGTLYSPWEPQVFQPFFQKHQPDADQLGEFLYYQKPFLQAEPDNPWDSGALAVYVGHRKKPGLTKMGYVKKDLAHVLRRRYPGQGTFPAAWSQIKTGSAPEAWNFTLGLPQACPSF